MSTDYPRKKLLAGLCMGTTHLTSPFTSLQTSQIELPSPGLCIRNRRSRNALQASRPQMGPLARKKDSACNVDEGTGRTKLVPRVPWGGKTRST